MKSFMDDIESWGAWQDPGAKTEASPAQESALPKPLTLADIRVGEEYVTLRRGQAGRLSMCNWKPVTEPRLYVGPYEELRGCTTLDIQGVFPSGTTFVDEIFAEDYGLAQPVWGDNGNRAFLATPEIMAEIGAIVKRQDHAAYAAIIGEPALFSSECFPQYWEWEAPTPPEMPGLRGRGVYQSLNLARCVRVDAFEPLEPPTRLLSLWRGAGQGESQKLLPVEKEEFLQRFADLLKTKG